MDERLDLKLLRERAEADLAEDGDDRTAMNVNAVFGSKVLIELLDRLLAAESALDEALEVLEPFAADGWLRLGKELWPDSTRFLFTDDMGLTVYGHAVLTDFRRAAEFCARRGKNG